MEYHKGEPCPYRKGVLCQEICMRCQIYEEEHMGEHKGLPARLFNRMGDSGFDRVDTLASGGLV